MPKHPDYTFDLDVSGFTLPEDFLFGVCNSPYHSEGGYNRPGGPKNNWWRWEESGKIERSGDTNRLWDDPAPHIDKAQAIGLNAFRMGFEWARVQPTLTGSRSEDGEGEPPAWDEKALGRYAEIIGMIYDAGMEPVITLHHFTNPAWVGDHLFLREAKLDLFLAYVRKVVTEVNTRLVDMGHPAIEHYVVFNEPFNTAAGPYLGGDHPPGRENNLASFSTALVNLLMTYIKAYDLVYDLYETRGWRRPQVGFNFVSYCAYEIDKLLPDLMRAPERGIAREEVTPYLEEKRNEFNKAMLKIARHRLGDDLAPWEAFRERCAQGAQALDLAKVWDAVYASPRTRKLDYIAVDTYDPFSLIFIGKTEDGLRPWWEWRQDPVTMREHLKIHAADLGDSPLIIMETNIGHHQPKFGRAEPRPDGLRRPQFLKEQLREVMRLIQAGVPLRGFLYWSLADNYEWGSAAIRLGLLEYDYETHTIKDTDGLGDANGAVFAELITALRSGDAAQLKEVFHP